MRLNNWIFEFNEYSAINPIYSYLKNGLIMHKYIKIQLIQRKVLQQILPNVIFYNRTKYNLQHYYCLPLHPLKQGYQKHNTQPRKDHIQSCPNPANY